ncbi:hypothetical protein AN958_10390 [Leucoagaricus sp. SymC.cos]|nr:hypothetical protein AN958_10390 [Leucoagaricus sp. SymC.cos]
MTIQQVVLNSFVKFEAGLNIQHLICGFEASQILVKNLPVDASRPEIIQLFTQQGIDEEDLVVLRTEVVGGCQQAMVLGKAADVETVALGLDGIEFRDKSLEFVNCERSPEGRTMGSSNRNSYHLSISWRPTTLTMFARYPLLEMWEISQKASQLNKTLLNGQRISAEIHWERQAHGTYGLYEDYYEPRHAYCIKISRIPNSTTEAMVGTFAGTSTVELHCDPSAYTSNDVLTALDAHIHGLANSTLRSLALENTQRPNSVSAKAIFGTWEGAKAAHDSLKDKILRPNFPSLRLYLSDPYRFVITIDEKQYNAQRGQWTGLYEGKGRDTNIQTRTVDNNRGSGRKVIITLFGRDKKVVGALKVRIESMAAGQKLDATHWHPTFKFGKGQEFLGGLYESTGAYARCDWRHNHVALFGRSEAIENAKSRIKEEVERISAEEWTIPLQRRVLGFFIRKGLAQMKSLLGEENVTLDVGSAKIILHGADLEEARHHLRQLMEAFQDQSSASTVDADDKLCPICYDTVSQPIEISCEHIYCSPCLRHYILSTLDNHSFPLKCMGANATCNKPLSLPLIRKFLPPQRFEHLLEAAFTSYLDKNPETFKYCNTPDCSQVYRTTALPQELQCPSCFTEVCTACHDEGHAGMTCTERRLHKDPAEERKMEAWAAENNAKKCPSCRVWVEKTEGCHHMTCKCGIHFCWICSGVFDPGRIYDHMTQAHGDWYNDPEHNRRQAGQQARQAAGAGPARQPVQNIALQDPHEQRRVMVLERFRRQREEAELREAEERRRQLRELEETRRRIREAEERERRARVLRQEMEYQAREAARRRELEARRRQTEESKRWCIIM